MLCVVCSLFVYVKKCVCCVSVLVLRLVVGMMLFCYCLLMNRCLFGVWMSVCLLYMGCVENGVDLIMLRLVSMLCRCVDLSDGSGR